MTNERDDEILGRALSRAIETIDTAETPYDRSRIGAPPVRRGTSFWRLSALAASIVIAGALGSLLLDRPATNEPVGVQPSATAPTNTQAATATPVATPTPQPTAIDHRRVFVARDGLPPTSQHLESVLGACPPGCVGANPPVQTSPEDRIRSRLNSLNRRFSGLAATPLDADVKEIYPASVRLNGDTVTVDYTLPSSGWPIKGATASLAWQQQLVYTATEEPGIRRVLITQNGGQATVARRRTWLQRAQERDRHRRSVAPMRTELPESVAGTTQQQLLR
jgi:hypothetical protein